MVVRGRKGRKRLSPEQRREEILNAAHRVFATDDPTAVTFEDIAKEAGVSRALVYNYFGDKGSLLAEVYTQALQTLDGQLHADLHADAPLADRVRAAVGHYVSFAESQAGGWHILGHVAATPHPAVSAARRARVAQLATALGATPAARLALAGFIGMLEEAITHWFAEPEVTYQELVELLEAQAWSGIGPLLSPRVQQFAS